MIIIHWIWKLLHIAVGLSCLVIAPIFGWIAVNLWQIGGFEGVFRGIFWGFGTLGCLMTSGLCFYWAIKK